MRKSKAKKRILLPDPKFNDTLVTRFINNVMWQGKKDAALTIFYDALDLAEAWKKYSPHSRPCSGQILGQCGA